jgi:hypothetical protein
VVENGTLPAGGCPEGAVGVSLPLQALPSSAQRTTTGINFISLVYLPGFDPASRHGFFISRFQGFEHLCVFLAAAISKAKVFIPHNFATDCH